MIHCPYFPMNFDESKAYLDQIASEEKERIKYLFVDDSFVSNRISWDDKKVKVNYYKLEDVKVPWYMKLFGVKSIDVNLKNQELYEEALSVAIAKKLMPVFPPLKYVFG